MNSIIDLLMNELVELKIAENKTKDLEAEILDLKTTIAVLEEKYQNSFKLFNTSQMNVIAIAGWALKYSEDLSEVARNELQELLLANLRNHDVVPVIPKDSEDTFESSSENA